MLTESRAKEIEHSQAQWPYWGNFSRFMTGDEISYVQRLFETIPGNPSFGGIVCRIARGEKF